MLKRRHGLKKYDAPLRIQFDKGRNAFYRGVDHNNKLLVPPYSANSMQYREWLRGFNSAFTQSLKKVINYETRRGSKEVYAR